MNLIPLVGTDEVTFGTHEKEIIKLLGRPTSINLLWLPTLSYEKQDLYYSLDYVLSSSARELISIRLGFPSFMNPAEAIFLWGTDISEYSSDQLLDFLCLKRSEEKAAGKEPGGDLAKKMLEEQYRDDPWNIEVLDDGIVIRDIDDGYWDIEVPECGIKIGCLGVVVEGITIHTVGD
jgi:hypothetical protein